MVLRSFIAAGAGLLLLLGSACTGSSASSPACNHEAGANVIVAASDYTSSEVGLAGLESCPLFLTADALGRDPALASSNGRLFWIARDSGTVIELDPRTAQVIGNPWVTSDPDGGGATDPQDIAVDPVTGNVWIARFNVSTVEVKTSDGSTELGTIDLSGVADVHRNPYMSSIRIIDGKAYVTLEMLDPENLQPTNPSYIVKLDVATALATGQVEAALELQGRNPFGLMVELGNSLYLADPGFFALTDETDAGIEVVDLSTFTSTLILRESDIGASVDELSVTAGCGTAIVAGPDPENVTSLISFDPATGALLTPLSAGFLYTDAGFELSGMAWLDGGVNLVGDRTAVAGEGYALHVLTASSGCTLTEGARAPFTPMAPVALQPTP